MQNKCPFNWRAFAELSDYSLRQILQQLKTMGTTAAGRQHPEFVRDDGLFLPAPASLLVRAERVLFGGGTETPTQVAQFFGIGCIELSRASGNGQLPAERNLTNEQVNALPSPLTLGQVVNYGNDSLLVLSTNNERDPEKVFSLRLTNAECVNLDY